MPTFVQANINTNFASAVATLTVTCSTVASGDLVCGFITQADATQTCTVKDNNGVSATMVPSSSGVLDNPNGNRAWMWYAPNVSGGPTSYIATFSVSAGSTGMTLQEWSGVATSSPLDQSNIANVASGTTPTGTAVTPAQGGELIFAGIVGDSSATGTISAGTNVAWALRNSVSADGIADESFVQGAAASIAGQFGFVGASASQLGIMTFKAAAAGGAAFAKQNFKLNRFKKQLGLGPNAGLFQVRAYPSSVAVPDTLGNPIIRIRRPSWKW